MKESTELGERRKQHSGFKKNKVRAQQYKAKRVATVSVETNVCSSSTSNQQKEGSNREKTGLKEIYRKTGSCLKIKFLPTSILAKITVLRDYQ